jgi:hypothetical protein
MSPTDVIGATATSESARNVATAFPISTLRWSPVAVTTTSDSCEAVFVMAKSAVASPLSVTVTVADFGA